MLFSSSYFLPVFQYFFCVWILRTFKSQQKYCSFHNRYDRPVKAVDHLRTGARDFTDVNNWRSNSAHNARKTDRAILLRPEYKWPLKSQIWRLYSVRKTEHIFVSVRSLRPRSAPAVQSKRDKKSRKRLYITIIPPYRGPVNCECWLMKARKNGLKIRQW